MLSRGFLEMGIQQVQLLEYVTLDSQKISTRCGECRLITNETPIQLKYMKSK